MVVDSFPDRMNWAWAREFYQRDSAIRGLAGRLAPDDLVLLSDADEIVDRSVVDRFSGEVRGLVMRTFQYFFNYEVQVDRHRIKTVMARGRMLAANGSSFLRTGALRYGRADWIPTGGWHFSSVKTPEDLEVKVKSYSHVEHAHRDADYFSRTLQSLREGGGPDRGVRREIDDSFPAYLRRHRDALARFIL